MCYFCLLFLLKCVFFFFFNRGMIEVLLSSPGTPAPRPPVLCVQSECRAYELQAIELITRSTVLQAACVAVKKPDFPLFRPSARLSCRRERAGPWAALLSWMYIFHRCECVLFFFSSPCWCVTFCPQRFCFHSYHQCFQLPPFPSPLLQSTNSPFPLPAASHSAKTTCFSDFCFFFSRMAFSFLIALFLSFFLS